MQAFPEGVHLIDDSPATCWLGRGLAWPWYGFPWRASHHLQGCIKRATMQEGAVTECVTTRGLGQAKAHAAAFAQESSTHCM